MEAMSKASKEGSSRKDSPKKVLYLLGLPGVGKTTVGTILAKRTGFALFDHNVTYKEVCRFLPKGTHLAHALNGRLHLAILNFLLHSSVPGVVCTISTRRQPTAQIALQATRLIEKLGGEAYFVKIKCDWDEHKKRVQMPSRKILKKTNTIQKLKTFVEQPSFNGIRRYPPLIIDNTNIPAEDCAQKIISDLNLVN